MAKIKVEVPDGPNCRNREHGECRFFKYRISGQACELFGRMAVDGPKHFDCILATEKEKD